LVQVPLHRSGVGELQPLTHVLLPPVLLPHTGVLPLQTVVQLPQWFVCVTSCSQPSSGFPLQSAHPDAHAEAGNVHTPPATQVVVPET
jgi:hypothetical protein